MLLAGPILTLAFNGKHYILVLSLIKLVIFSLWTCPFNSIVSLGFEIDHQGFDQ